MTRHRIQRVVTIAGDVTITQGQRVLARVGGRRRAFYIDESRGDVYADNDCMLFADDGAVFLTPANQMKFPAKVRRAGSKRNH